MARGSVGVIVARSAVAPALTVTLIGGLLRSPAARATAGVDVRDRRVNDVPVAAPMLSSSVGVSSATGAYGASVRSAHGSAVGEGVVGASVGAAVLPLPAG